MSVSDNEQDAWHKAEAAVAAQRAAEEAAAALRDAETRLAAAEASRTAAAELEPLAAAVAAAAARRGALDEEARQQTAVASRALEAAQAHSAARGGVGTFMGDGRAASVALRPLRALSSPRHASPTFLVSPLC